MQRDKRRTYRTRLGWPVAALVGLGLVVAVVVASAATAAPQDNWPYGRRLLSDDTKSAAYPDIDASSSGLVAAVWTEGPGGGEGKHVGPLILRWSYEDHSTWEREIVDPDNVTYAALDVLGPTVHIVWSKNQSDVYYQSCTLSGDTLDCASSEPVIQGAEGSVFRVDIAVDTGGTRHVVWVESDEIHYAHKADGATGWTGEGAVPESFDGDFPALTATGDAVHLAWAESQPSNLDPDLEYSAVNYCRRSTSGGDWSCVAKLAEWEEHPARNLSIAADEAGNVYVVWDYSKEGLESDPLRRLRYYIGYRHYDGAAWKPERVYPYGDYGGAGTVELFNSGEQGSENDVLEYAHFLRPHVSLAASGTLTVPVLAWHTRLPAETQDRYRVLWTYATHPGSDGAGNLYWSPDYADYDILSTDGSGNVDADVDSASARLSVVGDLRGIIDSSGSSPHEGFLHAIYHEGDANPDSTTNWKVYYTSSEFTSGFIYYLPLSLRSAGGGEG